MITIQIEKPTKKPIVELIEKYGFYKISAFGEYKPSGLCLFYEKRSG